MEFFKEIRLMRVEVVQTNSDHVITQQSCLCPLKFPIHFTCNIVKHDEAAANAFDTSAQCEVLHHDSIAAPGWYLPKSNESQGRDFQLGAGLGKKSSLSTHKRSERPWKNRYVGSPKLGRN